MYASRLVLSPRKERVDWARFPMWVLCWQPWEDRSAICRDHRRGAVAAAAAVDAGVHFVALVASWLAFLPVVSSSCLVLLVPVELARLSPLPPWAPSSASFADSGTRSWFAAPLDRGHVRSLFVVFSSGNGWSGTPFLARAFGIACTSVDLYASDTHWDLEHQGFSQFYSTFRYIFELINKSSFRSKWLLVDFI